VSCICKLLPILADDRKLGVVSTSDSCAAIQRDINRQEKCEEKGSVKLKKRKCRALQLGRNSPMHWYTLGADCLESSFAEEDLHSTVNSRLHLRQ